MADSRTRGRAASPAAPPPLLNSPWLSHELFAATKKTASAPDGLAFAKKSAVAKIAQELKRGRNYIDHKLKELEDQLINVTDFLNGTTATLFTDYGLPESVENGNGSGALTGNSSKAATAALAAGAIGRLMDPEEIPTSPNSAGLRSKFVQHNFPGMAGSDKTNPLNPMGTAVEDDLAADTPCTTVGLWKYAAAYDIFKDVTLEDVEAALQLEESTPDESDEMDLEFALYKPSSAAKEKLLAHVLGASDGSTADDFLKARLVAALIPVIAEITTSEDASVPSLSPPELPTEHTDGMKSDNSTTVRKNLEKKKSNSVTTAPRGETEPNWSASGVTSALRDAGLLECSDEELHKRMLSPEDDQVSSEIRDLQLMVRDHACRSNETKRVLRNFLQGAKPWLAAQEDANQAIEKKYLSMWRRKKELERKKKLKDKKLMRKEALSGEPPAFQLSYRRSNE